jgi:hypothetical protein
MMAFLRQPYKSLQTWFKGWKEEDVMVRPPGEYSAAGLATTTTIDSLVNWVLPGKLALGRLPQPGEGIALRRAKIRTILSLCTLPEGTLPDEIQQQFDCYCYPLPDSRSIHPLLVQDLARSVDLVEEQLQQGKTLYLHCVAGIERSPLVCIAYLCRYHHLELWESLHLIRQIRPVAMPTESQIQVLRNYLCEHPPAE